MVYQIELYSKPEYEKNATLNNISLFYTSEIVDCSRAAFHEKKDRLI